MFDDASMVGQGRGANGSGPIALVGSGEFLEGMLAVDSGLFEGRSPVMVHLPTAAGLEGDERVDYWMALGERHCAALGVSYVGLRVLGRAESDDPAWAEALLQARPGLVYLSGGNPSHLASTLRGTPLWEAILAHLRAGGALAGCSAGAMAITSTAPDPTGRLGPSEGLGLLPGLAVVPHHDWAMAMRPAMVSGMVAAAPPGVTVVGIDEDTALVGGGARWSVQGRGAVWLLGGDNPTRFGAGDQVTLHADIAPMLTD
jgi:cyanophycinase